MKSNDEARALVNHLKKSRGLTQAQIARKLGYNPQYFSQALNEEMTPKLLGAIKAAFSAELQESTEEILEAKIRQLQAMFVSLQKDHARLVQVVEGTPELETLNRLNLDTIQNLSKLA